MKTLGVIGLGNMGRGMALSARRGGFRVLGYDVTPGTTEALQAQGVQACESIAAITRGADVLILSLPSSAIVEEVVFGKNGVAEIARSGQIVIDTTTANPDSTRKVAAALAKINVGFVDAPVSGGPGGAATATMTMVLGGSPADIEAVEPILSVISAKRVHVGPVGAGHVTKIIDNMLTGVHLLAAGEPVRAAQANDVDPEKLVEAPNSGSGRNSATLTNYPVWIFNGSFDSGFTMKLMRKDVRLAMVLLDKVNAGAPIAKESGRLWAASETSIDDAEDFNRMVQFIESK